MTITIALEHLFGPELMPDTLHLSLGPGIGQYIVPSWDRYRYPLHCDPLQEISTSEPKKKVDIRYTVLDFTLRKAIHAW